MALSFSDAAELRDDGFQDFEIEQFASAKTPNGLDQPAIDIHSSLWQAVRHSRREWYDSKLKRGWTNYQIVDEIRRYYRKRSDRSPFDFLKAEYKPPQRLDYISAVKARSKTKDFLRQRYNTKLRRRGRR